MSDDFRVHAELDNEIGAGHLLKKMHESEIAGEVQDQLGGRLPVSAEGRNVFVYTPDRAQADAAAAAVADVLTSHDLRGVVTVSRWHPDELAWKDADEPLPATPEQQAAEHANLEQREAQESAALGDRWEVRIDLATHAEAVAVADRLETEGLEPLRRWKHIFLLVPTEDDANALATRLRGEDLGAEAITVEGQADDAWRATHPYAILGGLGG